jgi:nitroimidazol reductase NimA-like FMN-containing flavoprotein (pyridoxamine 5'-phosphate oxidase superfamily)
MKQVFEIKEKHIINSVLDSTEYGTLAVSHNDEPYAVPLNFVRIDDIIYFHGALSNKKMKILKHNPKVSFSVVQSYSLIASFFSSTDGLACPATQFFKSVSIDGVTKLVDSREEKAMMFEALMLKLQPEGKYKAFTDAEYDTALKATAVIKIIPNSVRCKFKFGQHLTDERFEMILSHLEERNSKIDTETIEMMKIQRSVDAV